MPRKPPYGNGFPALRQEILDKGFSLVDVATEGGFPQAAFSRYLGGSRTAPEGFEVTVRAAVRRLERERDEIRAAIRERRQGAADGGDAA